MDRFDEINREISNVNWWTSLPIERREELRTAEEQGLLVRLPCKLETPIVRILEHCTHGEDCDEHCNDRDTGEPCERKQATGRCRVKLWERGFNYCDIGDVGKTVFLTREEAEKALEGQK